jgi:lipid II:glycine glycyltransferase (peptidoglycan interpeptide bridge formation enzyme)
MKIFNSRKNTDRFTVASDYCSPHIDLPNSSEKMFARLKAKTRNQIRKGGKAGLKAICGDNIQLQKDFFKVYSAKMKEHGTPTHGWRWFKKLYEHFKGQYLNIIAYLGTKPIAGVMLFFEKNKVIVHYGSSIPGTNHLCPNNITYWQALQESIDRGFKLFDFGRSRIGSGTYHFKMQWEAENQITPYLYFARPGQKILQEDPSSPIYSKYARLWRLMPLSATQILGPCIRKHITT